MSPLPALGPLILEEGGEARREKSGRGNGEVVVKKKARKGGKRERQNRESGGRMSSEWRDGWAMEDGVMRQRGTKAEAEKHGERV